MNIQRLCDLIIRSGFFLLFILVPLILTPFNYELFEYNKMMVTYGLTAVITATWIIKMANRREIRIARTPIDIPILLFLASQFISALYSNDPHVSWFGYYSRFNGGLWSVISYVVLFYAFVSNFLQSPSAETATQPMRQKVSQDTPHSSDPDNQRFMTRLLKVILSTGMIVAIYGILERLGIDKHLWVQDVQNRVFSTLGQPNWLAAYLVVLIPIAFAFLVKNSLTHDKKTASPPAAIAWGVLSVMLFMTLLFTRSRSGLLGFAVSDVLFWTVVFLHSHLRKPAFKAALAVHIAMLVIVFVNGTHIPQVDRFLTFKSLQDRITKEAVVAEPQPQPSGTLLEYGGTESGTIRKYVWEAAVTAWRHSPKNMLIGTGTETYAWTFFRFRPVGHNLVSEWDFLYNKAHNEFLNYLATTGILGLGSYLLLVLTVAVYFVKAILKTIPAQKRHLPIIAGLFAGWVSILITNFFGFSVVIIQLFFFLLPALTLLLAGAGTKEAKVSGFRMGGAASKVLTAGALITGTYILTTLVIFWRADTLFATGYRYNRIGQYANAKAPLEQAVSMNPGEPLYHDELSGTLAPLAMALYQQQEASAAAAMALEAIKQSDRAISISPENVNFWKTRTKVFYTFSEFNPEFNDAAINALTNAKTLSPNDPRIYYNLAILYGRKEETDQAIELLLKAKEMKPNYRDAYYGLYVFYTELKQPDKARAELSEYLTKVDPNDEEFKERLDQ
jgi:putative inorganic carbon (hco3(-)) transporter